MSDPTAATVTLNDVDVQAAPGATVLEVARAHGVRIPTLCHHDGLPAYGACRLCVVEVTLRGRTRLESACTRSVEDGMIVHTDTDAVVRHRRMIAELLLARCPGSEQIRELAGELGVTSSRFAPLDDDCVLCGLCVRACRDAIGVSAIGFVNRGMARRVSTPLAVNSEVCVGCGACAQVCPTGAIRIEDVDGKRVLRYFNTELAMKTCSACGAFFTTRRRAKQTAQAAELPRDVHDLCPECRRRRQARSLERYRA
jgi:bidirectional [NiFe] hydrogenase diaphorase subunit